MIITSALMIWKSLVLFTGSESPVSGRVAGWQADGWCGTVTHACGGGGTMCWAAHTVCSSLPPLPPHPSPHRSRTCCRTWCCTQVVVVLSGSMEPGFYRGDILFLYKPNRPAETGEISAFVY